MATCAPFFATLPSGPSRTTIVALRPQRQIVRTSRNSSASARSGLRTGEEIALKIGPQPVAHDRDAKPVCHAGKLPDLFFFQKLRLVDKNAVHCRVVVVLGDAREKVVAVSEHLRIAVEADARGNVATIFLAVVARDEQHRVHPALAVIVGCLQEHGRLAGIHGRVVEVEFCHRAACIVRALKHHICQPENARLFSSTRIPSHTARCMAQTDTSLCLQRP